MNDMRTVWIKFIAVLVFSVVLFLGFLALALVSWFSSGAMSKAVLGMGLVVSVLFLGGSAAFFILNFGRKRS